MMSQVPQGEVLLSERRPLFVCLFVHSGLLSQVKVKVKVKGRGHFLGVENRGGIG